MGIRIGELAKITGCQPVTIRYYEKEGLLNAPERSNGNYRLYNEKDIERLQFVRHCRQHGINLSEIRELLEFTDNPVANCDWINALIQKHIEQVEQQIKDLEHLKTHLKNLSQRCSGGKKASCGIIENLRHCQECEYCEKIRNKGTF